MLLRSGRATSWPRSSSPSRRGSCRSSHSRFDATAKRNQKRKSPEAEVEAVVQGRSKLPTTISQCKKHPPVDQKVKEEDAPPPLSDGEPIHMDAYLAKVLPALPMDQALHVRADLVDNASVCLFDYNKKNQANFKYKASYYDVSNCIFENQRMYQHMNFLAEDENGPKLFFAEYTQVHEYGRIWERFIVSCCCPVSANSVGGRGIKSIEELASVVFKPVTRTNMDKENCYACSSQVKHPEGELYTVGHSDNVMHYFDG